MRTWRIERANLAAQLDVSRATRLVAAIGGNEPNAFAAEILKLFDDALSITQCTIFAYEFGNRPRTMSVADHRGGRYLRDLADTYARDFYALDGTSRSCRPPISAHAATICCCTSRPATRSITKRIVPRATAAPTYPTGWRC